MLWRVTASLLLLLLLTGCGQAATPRGDERIAVVAAENFYGDVAAQIGGSHVTVTSILSDPSQDPHLYESSVDNAKAVGAAQLVIKNGLGYDAFMDKLLAASPRSGRQVIDVGTLVGAPSDGNPHVWYDPTAMPKVAQAIANALASIDPANKAAFDANLQTFAGSLKPLQDEIAAIKAAHAGAKVLPTEPVFDDMAEALGLDVVDKDGAFQRAVEDGNDPPAQAVTSFRQQLTSRAIKVLIYNSQAVTPITTDMQNTARQNGVAVVGISETEPAGKTFQQWQLEQLQALDKALGGQP